MHSILYKFSERKRLWEKAVIILKDNILYELGGINDKVAKKSTFILGYKLEPNFDVSKNKELIMSLPRSISGQAFRLTHLNNMESILFYSTETNVALKWISALQEGACSSHSMPSYQNIGTVESLIKALIK